MSVGLLELMAQFGRDAVRQAQLASLQAQVDEDLQQLVLQLSVHYEGLLKPGAGAAADAAAGGIGSLSISSGGGSSGSATGRDLASLHNLVQRLGLGCRMGDGAAAAGQLQQWPAAAY